MDEEKETIEVDSPSVRALTDHDYTPPLKRFRSGYSIPPLDDLPLKIEKNDPGGGGPPRDLHPKTTYDKRRTDSSSKKNYTNSGGIKGISVVKSSPVVVNLRNTSKMLIDEIELE